MDHKAYEMMMLAVHAGEELRMLQALREPGTSTLLSNTTIDRLIDVLERVLEMETNSHVDTVGPIAG